MAAGRPPRARSGGPRARRPDEAAAPARPSPSPGSASAPTPAAVSAARAASALWWRRAALAAAALATRAALFSQPHSGEGRPPLFGDFEAQRHWMEVTVNLPVAEWYAPSPRNDLQYWGLDYPPLTAYASAGLGRLARAAGLPGLVEERASRGHESPEGKLFMRATVLAADALVLLPAALAWAANVDAAGGAGGAGGAGERAAVALLFSPALLLVDHAHFQYNGVALGLALASAAASGRGRHALAAALFAAALNFKHMTLYYAPAVFVYLLALAVGGGLRGGGDARAAGAAAAAARAAAPWAVAAAGVARVGAPVLAVFGALWAPFCVAGAAGAGGGGGGGGGGAGAALAGCAEGVRAVAARLFPLARGLFEDKVANLWCALEPVLRLRRALFGAPAATGAHARVAALCAAATAALLAPSLLALWRLAARAPPPRALARAYALALFNTSLAFFLAAYQVHEKSVLLPALWAAALAGHAPLLAHAFGVVAAWTLWPLFRADGCLAAATAATVAWAALTWPWEAPSGGGGGGDGGGGAGPPAAAARALPEVAALARALRVPPAVADAWARRGLAALYALLAAVSAAAALDAGGARLRAALPDAWPYATAVVGAALFTAAWAAGTALLLDEARGVAAGDGGGARRPKRA